MRKEHALPLALTLLASLGGCTIGVEGDGTEDCVGGKCDDPEQVAYDETIPHIVPREMYEFFQANQWGLYHEEFHALRRWFLMSQAGRDFWTRNGYHRAFRQEGDPTSGLEFLAMHHQMMAKLHEIFDGLGYGPIIDGWKTDEEALDQVAQKYGMNSSKYRRVKAALEALSNSDQFANDDAFGLKIQTNLRLAPYDESGDQPSDWQNYVSDPDPTSGVHNYLHGLFQDDESPINVGDPLVNLANREFWGIHGLVEAKWQKFRADYRARMGYLEGEDDPEYLDAMDRAGLHVQVHSHNYQLDGVPPRGENLFGDAPAQEDEEEGDDGVTGGEGEGDPDRGGDRGEVLPGATGAEGDRG